MTNVETGRPSSRAGRRFLPLARPQSGPLHPVAGIVLALGLGIAATGCGSGGNSLVTTRPDGSVELFDGRVVPPLPKLLGLREQFDLRIKWLEQKHAALLPMMRQHGIAMWIVTNEEFHADPVTQYIAPDFQYTQRFDVHAFVDAGADGLKRYSSFWRPTATYARFFEPLPVTRSARGLQDIGEGLKTLVQRHQPRTIGLNYGGNRGQSSGLTLDAHQFLSEALGPATAKRFVSAGELIEEYFDTRLPDELEPYRQLVLATDVLAQRALSNEVITPGVTTAADLEWWFQQQIASLGVSAEPWFEIHTAVQRFDSASGRAIPYVHPAPDELVYQRGDIIHLDTGFDYLGFASDWQKVAYILREEERDAPDGLKLALRNGNIAQEAMRTEPRPGMTGREATIATLKKLEGVAFLPSLYSHPIGYQGHALGANINARNAVLGPPERHDSRLRPGSYRSIELSAKTALPEWKGDSLLIPFEDDAYLTENGYEWFRPTQTAWYLIR